MKNYFLDTEFEEAQGPDVELKNAWPSKWADTREEAVEQFEKWVDKTIPLD